MLIGSRQYGGISTKTGKICFKNIETIGSVLESSQNRFMDDCVGSGDFKILNYVGYKNMLQVFQTYI